MKKKDSTYSEILQVLVELKTKYPTYGIGKHLSTALEDYGDLWGVSDKEILYALEKYEATLEYTDVPRETSDEELKKIIEGGLNLSSIYTEEEDL